MTAELASLLAGDDLARVRAPLARAWTLPPAAYTEPRIFDLEVQRIFHREWICVARIEQLAEAGDYRCVNLVDQPVVVTRAADGALHAFSPICLHRAMPVVQGSGNARRFVCPYHNWTYELDGRLRSAPMMEGVEAFDARSCRLPTLAVEVWQGFVFVNMNADAAPLAEQLQPLADVIANYRFDQLVIAETLEFDSPWNWKILVENFMEAYHHIGTHRHTFEPVYPARASRIDDNGGGPWTLLRMPAVDTGADGDAEQGLPPLPGLTAQERHQLLAACVYPTLLFAAASGLGVWYQLEPSAHDRMLLRIHALLPREIAAVLDDAGRAAIAEQLRVVHLEDIEVNAGPWRGLNAPLTGQGRLSLYEKAVWQLNQQWLERLEHP